MRIPDELVAELAEFRKRWKDSELGAEFIREWWKLADRFGLNHSALVGETIVMLGDTAASDAATCEPTGSSRTFHVTDAKYPPRKERGRVLKELGKARIDIRSIDWIAKDVGAGRVGFIAQIEGTGGRRLRPPHHGGPVRALSLEQLLQHACRRQLERGVLKGRSEITRIVEFGEPPEPIRMPDGSLRHRPAPELSVTKREARSLPGEFVASWVQRVRQRAENVIAVIWDDPGARVARPYTITMHMLPPRGRRAGMKKFRGRQGMTRAGSIKDKEGNPRARAPLLEPRPVSRLFDLVQQVAGLDLRQPASGEEQRAWEALVLERLRELQPHLSQLDEKFTFLTVTPAMTREEALRWWPEIERQRGRPGSTARGVNPYRRAQAKLWATKADEGMQFLEMEHWYRNTFSELRFCYSCTATIFAKPKETETCPGCDGPTSPHPRPDERSSSHPSNGAIREAVRRFRQSRG